MPQSAHGTQKRPQRLLRALRPPARGAQTVQRPHHEGEVRPGRLQQVALLHVRPPAQPGPAGSARLADVGKGPFHPLGAPAVIALPERPQPAGPVLVENDRRRGAPLVRPPAAARLATLREVGAIPLGLQAPKQGGLVVAFVRDDLPARLGAAYRRVVILGCWGLRVAAADGLQVTLGLGQAGLQRRRIGRIRAVDHRGDDSPGLQIARELLTAGADVVAWDAAVTADLLPAADAGLSVIGELIDALRAADAAILCTEWPEIVDLDFARAAKAMKGRLLVDGRYAWDPIRASNAGLDLVRIGTSRPVRRTAVSA